MSPRLHRPLAAAVVTCAALLVLTGTSRAQGGPLWIPLFPGVPPGAPAVVAFIAEASNDQQTTIEVTIPGFWSSTFVGPDGRTYHTVEVPTPPGLGPGHLPTQHAIGSPALPVARFALAVPGLASPPAIADVSQQDLAVLPGFGLVAPEFVPAMDDSQGTPALFTRDEAIYGAAAPWPAGDGTARPAQVVLGAIPTSDCMLFPAHSVPSTGELRIYRHARFTWVHGGLPPAPMIMSQERTRLAEHLLENWGSVADSYVPNLFHYDAEYLIVARQALKTTLNPLIAQKLARGFRVSFISVETAGSTCSGIRSAIGSWYASTPPERDHYCLLVGDTDAIPMCLDPYYNSHTDDLYASTDGIDAFPEIYLGRLSVNGQADLADQVSKIMAYENSPPAAGAFDRVLLVAHQEASGSAGSFEAAHEDVRNASYSTAPTFQTAYGSNGLVTNATVSNAINNGLGLVAYRGHGSATTWGGWGVNQTYTPSNVAALNNAPMTPVVWSLACSNQALDTEDCIGETWMGTATRRAVSHYGATQDSDHNENNALDVRLFEAVWDLDITTESQAIAYAEQKMYSDAGDRNTWLYLLLGDPDLQIRRRPPKPWLVINNSVVSLCTSGQCQLDFQILDAGTGAPLANVLVAAWKPAAAAAGGSSIAGGGDEVFDNRYTDANGIASLVASPTTTGSITFTVQDREGNASQGSIEVTGATGVPPGAETSFGLRAEPSVTRGGTFFALGHTVKSRDAVVIFDVAGRQVRRLEVGDGLAGVRWDGLDTAGRAVTSGLYLARAEGAGGTARVIIAR